MFIGFKKRLFNCCISIKTDSNLKFFSHKKCNFICWIVDFNYLRTSENFIRWIGHLHPMDNVIQAANNKLGVSSIILRKDIEVSSKMYQVNEDLKRLCNESGFSFIDNSIIDEFGLNNSKLHLSAKGSAFLAIRFIKFLNPA